jgi:thiol:disulfide interchange protein DsbD
MIDSHFSADLASHPLGAIAIAFSGGVLASWSPCLYPMIPITASIIGGTRETTRRARFALALVYVAGLAAVYSGLGLLAGLTGTLFGAVSTSPWVSLPLANVLIAAALMTADIVTVPIPEAWHRRRRLLVPAGASGARSRWVRPPAWWSRRAGPRYWWAS